MKWKNFKLGTKLAIGFGVLIIISMILGGIAVMNMAKITQESKVLAKEYVPEVNIATDLRGAVNRTMYEMRGYGFTEEESFYTDAQKEISAIKKSISEGEDLDSRAKRLVRLSKELKIANDLTDEYIKLAEQTVELNKILAEERKNMDANAEIYMNNCEKYFDSQKMSMTNEIRSEGTTETRLLKITLINDIIQVGNAVRVGNFKSQATRNPQILQEALKKFSKIDDLLNEIRKHTHLEVDLNALDKIEESGNNYHEAMEIFIEHWIEREELAEKREAVGRDLIDASVATADAGIAGTQKIADNAITLLRSSSVTMISGLILALIIGIVFAIFLTRNITSPIIKGVNFARLMSEGDLTATITVEQDDEIGQLANALRNMGDKLRSIVEDILSGANNIATASQQMSSTSQQMSQGSNEQASSVEEVSSTMEEITSNIEQNSENSAQTEKISITARDGMMQVKDRTIKAVEANKNIADKIKIINDIAFQTNILALNAAVEAARAGEHGKGFAVVAAEVRKLAERSKVAAEEIVSLAQNSFEITQEAGEKLETMLPEIEKTTQLVQEISAAGNEMTNGASQVNGAMQQLNNVTQQSAAASEELATSAEELSSQAEILNETVSFFKTNKVGITYSSAKQTSKPSGKYKLNNKKPVANKKADELSLSEATVTDTEFESF
jgi:methyl-accepting chemotaxis protein